MRSWNSFPGNFALSLAIGLGSLLYGIRRWHITRSRKGGYISNADPFRNTGFFYVRNVVGAALLVGLGLASLWAAAVYAIAR